MPSQLRTFYCRRTYQGANPDKAGATFRRIPKYYERTHGVASHRVGQTGYSGGAVAYRQASFIDTASKLGYQAV
jgi:hypothetical protein